MKNRYSNRFYRFFSSPEDLISFKISVEETDLFICADKDLSAESENAVKTARFEIEKYIKINPDFKESLSPISYDDKAPDIIKNMLSSSLSSYVGPMASVAGAIAEYVGKKLLTLSRQVIVENGGDIYISSSKTRRIAVFAGNSIFTDKIAIEISPKDTPCGVCTSSGTVGESLSFGNADAVVVYSKNCALADAAATSICNIVKTKEDINEALIFAKKIQGVEGILIIINNALGAWGKMKIVDIN